MDENLFDPGGNAEVCRSATPEISPARCAGLVVPNKYKCPKGTLVSGVLSGRMIGFGVTSQPLRGRLISDCRSATFWDAAI